jgi:hypothetical protein
VQQHSTLEPHSQPDGAFEAKFHCPLVMLLYLGLSHGKPIAAAWSFIFHRKWITHIKFILC